MAKFILGGIVTNIAGSVGGTTLRRVKNGFSMYNKIKGTSVSKLLQNIRVPQIANIFQRWSLLSDSERAGWNAQALLVTFPDKFGVAKNLTGRQLFSKANIQSLPVNVSINDSTGFTNVTNDFTLNGVSSDLSLSQINVDLSSPGVESRILISVEISNKKIYQPTFKSRKVIVTPLVEDTEELNLYSVMLAEFPYLSAGMYYIFYAQVINDFGMVSPYQYFSGVFNTE